MAKAVVIEPAGRLAAQRAAKRRENRTRLRKRSKQKVEGTWYHLSLPIISHFRFISMMLIISPLLPCLLFTLSSVAYA